MEIRAGLEPVIAAVKGLCPCLLYTSAFQPELFLHHCTEMCLMPQNVARHSLNVFQDYVAAVSYTHLKKKDQLAQVPITFFCLHGNHEMRPSEALGYELAEYHGGKVWMQPAYPNILFAIDGEVYDFNGNSCIVIGGAYSVDK